jgi:hypothetical protein
MEAREHSVLREGVVTGLIGAAIVAVWYFIADAAAGQPLHTPSMLGKIFLRGDLTPGTARIVPAAVLGYSLVHFALFLLLGIGLTKLTHLASRSPTFRMGVWIGLLLAFGLFAGATYSLGLVSGERFSPWPVIVGSLLGVLGMAGYLWRRHPRLVRSLQDVPLGSEVPPPPHPPERPRAA